MPYKEENNRTPFRDHSSGGTGRDKQSVRQQHGGSRGREQTKRFPDDKKPRYTHRNHDEETRSSSYRDYEYSAASVSEEMNESHEENYILTGRNPIREALKNNRDLEKLLVLRDIAEQLQKRIRHGNRQNCEGPPDPGTDR